MRWRRAAWVVAVVLLSAAAACTVLLDRSTVQCHTDADCVHFGSHPTCSVKQQICVSSGVAPSDCFSGTPGSDTDFYNTCSQNFLGSQPTSDPLSGAECLSFDNCGLLGLCGAKDAGVDGTDPLTPPPVADAGAPADGGGTLLALPNCADAAGALGTPVYLSGSSNFVALLRSLSPIINGHGLVPVFRITDSCTGASAMNKGSKNHIIYDPAPGSTAAYAQYFDANQGAHNCLLGASGVAVDVGESEIFPETCGLQEDPTNVSHQRGPILPILFVVPRNSKESTISAAAAREVLGNGGMGAGATGSAGTIPWTMPTQFFIRGGGTATTRLIGLAIGVPVPPNTMWGIDQGSAQKLAANLSLITELDQSELSIGLLGSDTYDISRLGLKALGFQANGQECAYLPDSSNFTRDKINVRDGHYPIWGLLHFYIALQNGGPVIQSAFDFVTPLTQLKLDQPVLDAFIDASWIPQCAMKVQRLTEMSAFVTNYPHPFPCGCYFDTRVSKGKVPDSCHVCTVDADCAGYAPTTACNYQFCELPPRI